MEMFNGMFGKIANGMCRLSMNGGIAVKTNGGYKTYDLKTNRLTNCSDFVFDIGEEFFFVIPTNKVKAGDIIIASGKPKCVVSNDNDTIKVINYEDSTVENILPERYVFMGNTYFYGKIVSMFGDNFTDSTKGMNKVMSYMLMSKMFNGHSNNSNEMTNMLPFMLMSGNGFGNMFDGMFDFDNEGEEENVENGKEND